jgi:hypothetical protein
LPGPRPKRLVLRLCSPRLSLQGADGPASCAHRTGRPATVHVPPCWPWSRGHARTPVYPSLPPLQRCKSFCIRLFSRPSPAGRRLAAGAGGHDGRCERVWGRTGGTAGGTGEARAGTAPGWAHRAGGKGRLIFLYSNSSRDALLRSTVFWPCSFLLFWMSWRGLPPEVALRDPAK